MGWYMSVLKQYANFSGRARRKEYWMFSLFSWIAAVVVAVVGLAAMQSALSTLLVLVYFVATVVPTIAVAVRRMHDTGRSGFWLFFSFVPVVGGITVLVFTVLAGQPGANRFGPDPKAAVQA